MIALIMMTATEMASYDDIKYFFWIVPVSTAVLYLLYVNGTPYKIPEEEIKSILALVVTFLCMLMAFFVAILIGP